MRKMPKACLQPSIGLWIIIWLENLVNCTLVGAACLARYRKGVKDKALELARSLVGSYIPANFQEKAWNAGYQAYVICMIKEDVVVME